MIMESKKLIHIFNLFIFLLIFEYTAINCKESFTKKTFDLDNNIKSSSLSSPLLSTNENNDNFKLGSSFEPGLINIDVSIGKVQKEFIYNNIIYNFIFDLSDYNFEDEIIVHFYALDCHIDIDTENNKYIKVENISNYEYDSYYAIITKTESKSNILVYPLIYSLNEIKKNRTYHLIINSFEKKEGLILGEKAPNLLYFNNNLTEIQLSYELNKNGIYPVVLSFFIKERVKFKVTVSDGKQNLFSKVIAYTDKILVNPNYFQQFSSYIYFTIKNIEGKDAVMITNIIGNHLTPIYFQNNILNLGFIPTNVSYQYYYMEVYEGEEGEIFLNNKKYNGILISKIIPKENNNYQIIQNYPKENEKKYFINNNEYLTYDEYSQKVYFYSSQTTHCKNGCYLLISYFSNDLNDQTKIENVYGTEFTLLSRIWDEQEFSSQLISIPLNEYIFWSYGFNYTNNNNYFTIFIPEDTQNIIFEIQGNNLNYINGCAKKGIIKINNFIKYIQDRYVFNFNNDDGKIIINLNCKSFNLDTFEKQYISFAFLTYYNQNSYANYYFRILQGNSINNLMLYTLDSNKNNLCQTSVINGTYSCFFLIKNDFKELSDPFIIYGYGQETIKYTAWAHYNNDYYSIDLNNCVSEFEKKENRTYLKIEWKNPSFIIVRIDSPIFGKLSLITNFHNNIISYPSIQLYSYQIFFIDTNKTQIFPLNFDLFPLYRIVINNTVGKTELCYNNTSIDNKYKTTFSEKKILSFIVSSNITMNIIKNLVFNLKIDYQIGNYKIKELFFDYDYQDNIYYGMPIAYYLKEIEYGGADINLYFNFHKNINDLYENDIIIRGFIVDYQYIKNIIDYNYIYYPPNENVINGKYDERTNNGLIVFEKEYILNKTIGISDQYYLIIINNYNIHPSFSLELSANSKNGSYDSIPINKYISGSFNLLINNKIQSQKYYIQNDEINSFILDLSSNYKNIELICNDKVMTCKKEDKQEGGVVKYYINIIHSNKITENYFTIQINNTNMENNNNNKILQTAYYTFKYYNSSNDFDIKQLIDISFTFNKGNNEIKIKNKKKIDKNISGIYTISGFLKIYNKKNISKNELLNTISPSDTLSYYLNSMKLNLDEGIPVPLTGLSAKEEYIASVLIKIENENDKEEKYFHSINFDFDTYTEEKNDNKVLIIAIVSICLIVIIIILIISIFCYRKMKKKNKVLKEEVEAITYSSGIDEDSLDNKSNKKKDEDYENTFI